MAEVDFKVTELSEDLTPQLGGDLDGNDNEIIMTSGHYIATDEVRAIDGDGLKLYDDGGNGIFIEDGGNIGIGETSPGHKLHLKDSGAVSLAIESTDTSKDKWTLTTTDTGGAALLEFADGDNIGNVLRLNGDNGNVDVVTGDFRVTNDYGKIEIKGTDVGGGAPIATVNFLDESDVEMGYIGYGSGGNNKLYIINSQTDEDIIIGANGTGIIYSQSTLKLGANIDVNNQVIATTITNGNISIQPNGTGSVITSKNFLINTDKFTVNASNGNTVIDGTLTATSALATFTDTSIRGISQRSQFSQNWTGYTGSPTGIWKELFDMASNAYAGILHIGVRFYDDSAGTYQYDYAVVSFSNWGTFGYTVLSQDGDGLGAVTLQNSGSILQMDAGVIAPLAEAADEVSVSVSAIFWDVDMTP